MGTTAAPKIIRPRDGKAGSLGSIGVRFIVDGAEAGERFSLVEHPMPPRRLAAPLHKHSREDEYSFVIEGRMGALLGDDVVYAEVGDVVFKSRDQWHTFWNAGDEPCRILEIISPAGFEKYFEELVDVFAKGPLDPDARREIAARYGLESQPDSIPSLCQRFGLEFGPPKARP
jgi:mannose-6-phosphate isomerase-like protein (cupin superfamily)